MHIQEGALSGSTEGIAVLCAGAVVTAAGVTLGLRRMDYERVPQVAMLSATLFVASLIHVPVGPVSVHLTLNGLAGLILGWAAFPAILVALFLQVVFFGYGGLTTLGINTLSMAVPAVACHYLLYRAVRFNREMLTFLAGFVAGGLAVVLGGLLMSAALFAAGRQFHVLAQANLVAHLVVGLFEGLVTASVVVFIRKVRPELLEAPLLLPESQAELPDA